MTEFSENKDDKKLDWMYRDASQIVDKEEYLLGRKIDKQFESSLQPDKDQEGLPPSIFSRGTTESQVDIARKLQEDPLYLIKKKEVEWREQLLKNPRKMKQLQEMIAKQKETAEKLKQKQLKKRKKKELDALLIKKCKKIFGENGTRKLAELQDSDSCYTSSSSDKKSSIKKKINKHKRNANLDRALALKYKQVIGDLDAKGIAEMDSTTESSSEDDSKKKVDRKKARSSSSPGYTTYKEKSKDRNMKKKTINEPLREKKYSSSDEESRKGNKNRKENSDSLEDARNKKQNHNRRKKKFESNIKRKYRRSNSSSSNSSEDICDNNQSSKLKKAFGKGVVEQKMYDSRHKFNNKERFKSYSEREEYSRGSPRNKRHSGKESGTRLDLKNDNNSQKVRSKHHVKRETSSRSSSESSSRDEKKRKNEDHPSSPFETKKSKLYKRSKEELSKSERKSSTSLSDSSSDEQTHQPKKQYGLVLPANYVPKIQDKKEVKQASIKTEEPIKTYRKEDKVKLTEKDKERKLKEMMDNAKWREEQRDKNIKTYKEKQKAEKEDYVYNEDFMRKQMAIAVSQGTVESRVKANINTIQRSGSSMNEHFARRK